MGYGGIKSGARKFRGLLAHGTVGYDLLRTPRVRQFIELDLLQPIVRTCTNSPGLSLTFGIGF